jgi:hypothetical protein
MKKLLVLWAGLFFLLAPVSRLWATVERIDGKKCDGVAAVIQGGNQSFTIQGVGVDLATGLSVSNPSLSAVIERRWNGAQNQADGGNIAWGKLQVKVTAGANAPAGNHTVTIRYPIGQDSFALRVIGIARITGATVPTFTQPFSGTVDVVLTGTGLSGASVSSVQFKRDAYTPLLDSSGQELPSLSTNRVGYIYITGTVNTANNTDAQVPVRLTFAADLPRLTKATVVIALSGSSGCSGFPASYTLNLSAPMGGPNYVASHTFDRPSYTIGDPVTITIRLDRAAGATDGRRTLSGTQVKPVGETAYPVKPLGETVYWAVIPSGAIQQGGVSATPFDPAARYNKITISEGQQTKVISFLVTKCPGGQNTQTIKFITWKPDPNNDSAPIRKETSFTVNCQR